MRIQVISASLAAALTVGVGVTAASAAAKPAAQGAAAVRAALAREWSHYDGIRHFADATAAKAVRADSVPGGHGGT